MNNTDTKTAAAAARTEAMIALAAWKAASRASWARGESCPALRAADDAAYRVYAAAADRRAAAERVEAR
jgi:hypothetical protein